MEKTENIGRFKKSWLLARGAWRALVLDKELFALPIVGGVISTLTLVACGVVALINPGGMLYSRGENILQVSPLGIVGFFFVGVALAIIATYISGALTYAAIERFKGGNPTVGSSLRAARKRLGSLTIFAIFSYIIGYILSEIAERIPYFGAQIVAWLAQASWGVASFFAIPIIVTSNKAVNPVSATKQSIGIIKKVWGESLIAAGTIGLMSVVAYLGYIGLIAALFATANLLSSPEVVYIALAIIGLLGLLLIALLFSMLNAFVTAAVYHFATTGESPVHFDKRLLRQTFTHKQAKKVFRA